METLSGPEALRQLPFVDIALPYEAGLKLLTDSTRAAIRSNIDYTLTIINPNHPHARKFRQNLHVYRASINELVSPGGMSIDEETLKSIYTDFGHQSYQAITHYLLSDVFPKHFKNYKTENSRGPGVICLGFLIDLVKLVKHEIPETDRIGAIIHAMKDNIPPFSFQLLGAMVDDSIRLKGTKTQNFDFIVDREAIYRFEELFLAQANPKDIEEYTEGRDISITELSRRMGVNLN